EYLIAMPFVFGLFCFYLAIAFKPDSAAQKPEKLYREKKLLAYIAVLIVILAILTFVDVPILNYWVEPFLLEV
ncbi:MAG: prenyltransferase, partial [Parasporobacterium sp.]|nr:prenyltransferase [Parasporobacterium sp.]